ncbi:STAS domain-containing protein [bacterium]|jgi:anti-anti-sigma factor|nr:STAS domain-containing protein [bacterium]
MALNVEISPRKGGGLVVAPKGRLDSVTAPDFEEAVDGILKDKVKVIILDMESVDFLSSAGIRVIFKLQKGVLGNRGVVVVSKPQPQVARVLEIVRAMPKEQIFENTEEADKYLAAIQEKELERVSAPKSGNFVAGTNLKIEVTQRKEGGVVISPNGRLDTVTAPELEGVVDKILAEKICIVILNMEGVTFISSAGIRVIFKLQKGVLKEKGVVIVSKPQPQVAKVLEVVRALPPEKIFQDIEAADKYLAMLQQKELEKLATKAVDKMAEAPKVTENDNLKITVTPREPRGYTVSLKGRLDSITSPDFEKTVDTIISAEAKVIILNLAELVFLSSAGIRVIFKLQKGVLQRKGVVVISKPQPQVAKVIEIIRALPAEQVFASDEEADAYLAKIQRQELGEV